MNFELWHWPQFGVAGMSLFICLAVSFLHGRERKAQTYNAYELILFQTAHVWVLWMGGFFP